MYVHTLYVLYTFLQECVVNINFFLILEICLILLLNLMAALHVF